MSRQEIPKVLRACLVYLAHLMVVLIGTAFVESALWPILGKASTVEGVVRKELAVSAIIAFALGAAGALWKPSRAANWVWTAPFLWLLLGVVVFETGPGGSVTEPETIWSYFGLDTTRGVARLAVANCFGFIVPAVRGLAYSIGSVVAGIVPRKLESSQREA
jgi:hypothetical protein